MLGVILCGGQSTRMGTDKGLIKTDGATWAQTAAGKMAALHLPVLLSVNKDQYNSYTTVFTAAQLVKDIEAIDVKGPLLGLLSMHIKHPSNDFFILACDMPLMETTTLKQLYGEYEKQTADAYVFTNNGVPEPLCAIYTAAALLHILQLLQTNQLARHSMKYALEQVSTFSVPLTENQKIYFQNFNALAELNDL